MALFRATIGFCIWVVTHILVATHFHHRNDTVIDPTILNPPMLYSQSRACPPGSYDQRRAYSQNQAYRSIMVDFCRSLECLQPSSLPEPIESFVFKGINHVANIRSRNIFSEVTALRSPNTKALKKLQRALMPIIHPDKANAAGGNENQVQEAYLAFDESLQFLSTEKSLSWVMNNWNIVKHTEQKEQESEKARRLEYVRQLQPSTLQCVGWLFKGAYHSGDFRRDATPVQKHSTPISTAASWHFAASSGNAIKIITVEVQEPVYVYHDLDALACVPLLPAVLASAYTPLAYKTSENDIVWLSVSVVCLAIDMLLAAYLTHRSLQALTLAAQSFTRGIAPDRPRREVRRVVTEPVGRLPEGLVARRRYIGDR